MDIGRTSQRVTNRFIHWWCTSKERRKEDNCSAPAAFQNAHHTDSCHEKLWVSVRTRIRGLGYISLSCPHFDQDLTMKSCSQRKEGWEGSTPEFQTGNWYMMQVKGHTFRSRSHRSPCPLLYQCNACWNIGWLRPPCTWSYQGHTFRSLWSRGPTGGTDGADCLITTMVCEGR